MPTKPRTHKATHTTPRFEAQPVNYGQGRGGRPWRRLRARILERDGHLCQCRDCKAADRVLIAHEVDHIVPLSRGGTDDPSNLCAINHDCHKAKTQREGGVRFTHEQRDRMAREAESKG